MRSQPALVPTHQLRELDLMRPAPPQAPRRVQEALGRATTTAGTVTAATLAGLALAVAGSVGAVIVGALAIVIAAVLAVGVAIALVAFAGMLAALSVCALAVASLSGASWMLWAGMRGLGRMGEWMGTAMSRSSMVSTAALDSRPSAA